MQDTNNQPTPVVGQPSTGGQTENHESIRSILSTVAVLLIAPVIAVFLTMFVFQSYQVDGQSMETTLQNGDRLIVWKVPKTWAKLSRHTYIPNRGDVVVFTEAKLAQFGQDPDKQLIKRVIALPGERVVVRDNILTVYSDEHPEGFQPDASLPYGDVIKGTPTDGEWTVKPGQIFVAGDNRSNSLDSRSFGPINANNIVGKLVVRVLPINNMKRF
jgi:signal peptidase I